MAAHRRLDRNRETAVIFTRSDFVAVACFRHRRGDQRTSCRMRSTFFDSVDFSIEAFNSVSHLSQISVWAKALQVRRVNRAVVPLAIHLAFDLSRPFPAFSSSVLSHRTQGMTLHFGLLTRMDTESGSLCERVKAEESPVHSSVLPCTSNPTVMIANPSAIVTITPGISPIAAKSDASGLSHHPNVRF